jgi:hypothetical protein
MPIFKLRKNKPDFFEQIIASNEILPAHSRQQGLAFLGALFSEIRPGPGKTRNDAEKNLIKATVELRQHKVVLANLQHALLSQLLNSNLTNAITESGIPLARGFWQELA